MSLQAIEPKGCHSLAMPEEEMGTGKQTIQHLITNISLLLYSRQMLIDCVSVGVCGTLIRPLLYIQWPTTNCNSHYYIKWYILLNINLAFCFPYYYLVFLLLFDALSFVNKDKHNVLKVICYLLFSTVPAANLLCMSIQHKAVSLHPRDDSNSSKIGQCFFKDSTEGILHPNFKKQFRIILILKPDNKSSAIVVIQYFDTLNTRI